MCYHHDAPWSRDYFLPSSRSVRSAVIGNTVVANLRGRLAETEARLERARAREAELSRRLEEMKRFISVMEILENYLKSRYHEQLDLVSQLLTPSVCSGSFKQLCLVLAFALLVSVLLTNSYL